MKNTIKLSFKVIFTKKYCLQDPLKNARTAQTQMLRKKRCIQTNTYVLGSLGSNYIDFGKGEGKSPKSCSL